MTRKLHPVLLGGSAIAALDIGAAFVLYGALGVPPHRILQGIASGLLGPAAFQGGPATAALGLLLHVCIAFTVAAAYFAASRWWVALVRRPIAAGAAYGVIVYLVMNDVVLPLSRGSFRGSPWHIELAMVVVHVLFVGLPIAIAVARAAPGRARPGATPTPEARFAG